MARRSFDRDAIEAEIDHVWSLGSTTNSQGLAFRASGGGRASRLYISDASNNKVTIYGPPSAGAPFVTNESIKQNGKTTATLNTALVPATFVRLCGCDVIAGGTHTVKTANALVTDPAEFVTTTAYMPASLNCTLSKFKFAPVAPPMFAPLNCH